MIKEIYKYTGVLVSAPNGYIAEPNRLFALSQDWLDAIAYNRRQGFIGLRGLLRGSDNVTIFIKKFGLSAHINTGRGDVVYDLIPEEM